MTTSKKIENAYLVLPYLVNYGQRRKTYTYKELGKMIKINHRKQLPPALEYIQDEICKKRSLPLINAIVVNKKTQLPGNNFLHGTTKGLTKGEIKKMHETIRDQVFECDKWDYLLKSLGLSSIKKKKEDFDDEVKEYLISEEMGKFGEGEAHRKLKEYVLEKPESIGIDAEISGEMEFLFCSGDRCDIVFNMGVKGYSVVEIKNGWRGELIKGIYQAIKYRSLMIAEKGQGESFPVQAYVAAYNIPEDIINYAKKFDIICKTVDSKLVEDSFSLRSY